MDRARTLCQRAAKIRPGLPLLLTWACIGPLLICPSHVFARGEEEFGNDKRTAQSSWPKGLIDVVNLKTRVYRYWVNGNENFFYRGKIGALNAALAKFAAIEPKEEGVQPEVFILPQKGVVHSFDQTPVACDWSLQYPDGIYLGMAKREKGTRVFTTTPTLTIYVGDGAFDLKRLKLPPGLRVFGVEERVARFLAGLKSDNASIRGMAAFQLGEYAESLSSIEPLRECLEAESSYVQISAARTLAKCGTRAKDALPRLRQLAESENKSVREACQEVVQKLEAAKTTSGKGYAERAERIRNHLKQRRGNKTGAKPKAES